MPSQSSRSPIPRSTPVLVALLALVALVSVMLDVGRSPRGTAAETIPGPPTRAARAAPTGQVRVAAPARRVASLVTPEAPGVVRLPSGRLVRVRPVSTTTDRRLDVPEDITLAGWWRGGARLGDPFGSMLVAAHIDSTTQGLGPFAELLGVRSGQRVRVTSPHLLQDFRIRSRRLVPQGSLAHQRWLFAPTGNARLTLVTCAPPFDRSRGGYQNLAVITALPVTGPVRRSR